MTGRRMPYKGPVPTDGTPCQPNQSLLGVMPTVAPPKLTIQSLNNLSESVNVSRTLRLGWALAFRLGGKEVPLPVPSSSDAAAAETTATGPQLPPSDKLRVDLMLAPFAELEKGKANNDAEGSTDRVVFLRSSEASTILFALHPIAGKYCKLIADLAEMGGGPGFGGDDAESISVGKLQPVPLSEVCSSSLLPEASPSRGAASLGEWASFIGLHEKDEAVSLSENPLDPAASAFQGGLLRSIRASAALLPPPLVIDVLGFDNAVLALIAAYSHMLAMRHYHLDKRGMLLDPTAETKEDGSAASQKVSSVGSPNSVDYKGVGGGIPSASSTNPSTPVEASPTYANDRLQPSMAYTITPKPATDLSFTVFTKEIMGELEYHSYEAVVARSFLLPFLPSYFMRPSDGEVALLERTAKADAPVKFHTATLAEELAAEKAKVRPVVALGPTDGLFISAFTLLGDARQDATDYPNEGTAAPPPIPYAEAKAKLDAIAATETTALKAALCRTASVMNAANFMQFTPLIELCGLCIAMIAKGRSPAALKELFANNSLYATVAPPA